MIESIFNNTSGKSDREMLEKSKKWRENIVMYSKRLNKNTIVYCSHEEKIKEFEKLYR